MIFETRYQGWDRLALEKEAKELKARYQTEKNRREVEILTEKLAEAEEKEDEEEMKVILRKIMELKKQG